MDEKKIYVINNFRSDKNITKIFNIINKYDNLKLYDFLNKNLSNMIKTYVANIEKDWLYDKYVIYPDTNVMLDCLNNDFIEYVKKFIVDYVYKGQDIFGTSSPIEYSYSDNLPDRK